MGSPLQGDPRAGVMSVPVAESSPMSTTGLSDALISPVKGWVIGRPILPTAPDDLGPGSGEHPLSVLVPLAGGPQCAIALLGPEVALPGVAGEVAECVAQLLVGGPAKRDDVVA